jgi:integrase
MAYRVREHLTEAEMDELLAALKRNRHGHRDWLIGLMIYRHGLRVSEACDLRWDDLDLTKRTIIVRRLKGSNDSTHYLERVSRPYCAITPSRASNRLGCS